MFTHIKGELKFRRIYTCTRCGASQTGDTESVVIDEHYVPAVITHSANFRPNPRYMPVGWASYIDGIRCEECES